MQSVAGTIRSLRPNVSREEALRHFTGGLRGAAAGVIRGRARSIAELYIPYRLFRVKISNRGCKETRIFALDAVEGTLVSEFPVLPGESEVVALETRNALPCRLAAEQMQADGKGAAVGIFARLPAAPRFADGSNGDGG